jgi:hypothetical protein
VDFGPKKLKQLQGQLAVAGYSENTIDEQIRRIEQSVEWGLIPLRREFFDTSCREDVILH